MEGSAEDLGAPKLWEVADLDESMRKLLLKDWKRPPTSSSEPVEVSDSAHVPASSSFSSFVGSDKGGVVYEDVVNQVDQFLREALQNPRERLSVLRMEQDVEKFICDPTQEQLEFQQLPTSYLRLAAHRVAQHYSLQSMVLLDNSLPDGSGSGIIVRKTSECCFPVIRLSDIPFNLPTEDSGALKFAIKQRPQKQSQSANNSTSHSLKSNSSKSVEERKEEYNRARARIFNSAGSIVSEGGKSEIEPKVQDNINIQHGSLGFSKMEENLVSRGHDVNAGRGLLDSTASSSKSARNRTEEPICRYGPNNRIAIFRDLEVDRKDPDYDRYLQRFDPGFGFNEGPCTMQPMYSPALNYNTEFPQLGPSHRQQISLEHLPRPLPQHLPRPLPQHLPRLWAAPSTATGIGFGHPETMMTPFNPNHVGARSTSSIYMHSPEYPCLQPGMPFIHSHEHLQQTYAQSHQQQPDASFGLARPGEWPGPCLHPAGYEFGLQQAASMLSL